MSVVEPQPAVPKPKLRWYYIRLIPLLAFITVFGWVAVKMQRAKQQRGAVTAVRVMHGHVEYDWERVPKPGGEEEENEVEPGDPPGPDWLRNLMGIDFFSAVVYVTLDGPDVTDVGLKRLKGLIKLRRLDLHNTKVTDEGVRELQAALPNCEIYKQ